MTSLQPVLIETRLRASDVLIVVAPHTAVAAHAAALGLHDDGFPHGLQRRFHESFGVAEALVLPGSWLHGKTLEEIGFRERLGLNVLAEGFRDLGPHAILVGLFVLTSLLSQFISNTATTVLIAPIALGLAADLGYPPAPLLSTVAIAASTAFATPVASPVNILVLAPGQYRFRDFLRVGVPLQLIALLLTVLLVPLLYDLGRG